MPGKSGDPLADATTKRERDDQTPSASGIVTRKDDPPEPGRRKRRESDRPSFRALTPYQARLDVEMDDTAVSKVRDPSVSISLGAEHAMAPRARGLLKGRPEALTSIALGVLLGVLIVIALAILSRVLQG